MNDTEERIAKLERLERERKQRSDRIFGWVMATIIGVITLILWVSSSSN